MAQLDSNNRDTFTSKFGVIAATAGSAIGLGNIWRFPYIVGENGGGAFLFVYLAFILAIGIPVMLSEFIIGRNAQRNPYGAFKKIAPGKPWFLVGLMGVVAAFMILAFYTVVAGWTLEYIYQAIANGFAGKSHRELGAMFDNFQLHSSRPVIWFFVFMIFTAGIVIAGVQKGIERYTKVLMPLLFVIIIILCIRSVTLPGAGEGLSFLFKPDFSKITTSAILKALGQAFFSLSIGMGTLITYGSYINKENNLSNTVVNVSLADTLIAVLAGVAIFPAVFAFGSSPEEGVGLVYKILPNIFQQMPGGYFFSILFFLLLGVAALTSTISMLEVIVAYFVEELSLKRKNATILAALSVSLLGVLSAKNIVIMKEKNIFDILNYVSVNILLPLGGLFIVLFLGWIYGTRKTHEEVSNQFVLRLRFFHVFMFLVKFVAPIAIAFVFLHGLGILG